MMECETPVMSFHRIYQRAKLCILSEGCPFDPSPPSACRTHKRRKPSLKERGAWFDGLSDEVIVTLYTNCQRCSAAKERIFD